MPKRKMLKGGSLSPDVIQGLLKKSYEKKPSSFNDYQIDKSLSGERVQVYYNPDLKQAVVVHRGSQGAKDWLVNDAGLMVGYRGNRFSHAQEIQNKAEKKYGAKNVTTLGHSLGAKVAEEVGQNSKEIITLNKPTVDMKKVSDKQYDIRTGSDVVSGFSGIATSNNKTTIPSGYRDPYSEHSPDVLSRLENKPIGRGMIGGTAPLDAVTTAKNYIRYQLRQISNINQPENKYQPLDELREYAYRRQAEHGGLRTQIRSIEAEIQRVTGTVIGFGNLKGGKKAVENLRPRTDPATTSQAEIDREEREAQIREALRAAEVQRAIDDAQIRAELAQWFPNINLAPIQNPDTMPHARRARNIGAPTGRGKIKGGMVKRGREAMTQNELIQERDRLTGIYTQTLHTVIHHPNPNAVLVTTLEILENLQNEINALEAAQGTSGIFEELSDNIFDARLALQESVTAEQREDDGETDEEGAVGGAIRARIYVRLYNNILNSANLIFTNREEHTSAASFARDIERLRVLADEARNNGQRYPDYPEFNQLANNIDVAIQELYARNAGAMEDIVTDVTDRNARNPRRPYQPPDLPPRRRGGGAVGGARYLYNPEQSRYEELAFWDRRTPDFTIRQRDINDFYRQYQAAFFQGRQQEVINSFRQHFNLTQDQFDYILRRIDTNPITRQRGWRADEEARPRREAQAAAEEAARQAARQAASIERGSNETVRPVIYRYGNDDRLSDLTNDRLSDLTVNNRLSQLSELSDNDQTVIPRYNKSNQSEDDDTADNELGAGRIDGYSQSHDCGCDSYRDFNALHAEGGGNNPGRVAPLSLEAARAEGNIALADVVRLNNAVVLRRSRAAEIRNQREQEVIDRNQFLSDMAELREWRDKTRHLFSVINDGIRDRATVGMYDVTRNHYLRLREDLGQETNPDYPTNFG